MYTCIPYAFNPIIRQQAITTNDRVVDKPRNLNDIPINNLVIHENDIPGLPMEEGEDDGIEDQNAIPGRGDRMVRNHNQREADQNRNRDRDEDINNPCTPVKKGLKKVIAKFSYKT